MKKSERLAAIRQVLNQQNLSTQQEVTQALADQGIDLTQATVSRLMTELGVVKFSGTDGRFYYGFPGQSKAKSQPELGAGMVLTTKQQDQFLHLDVVPGTSLLVKRQLLERFSGQIFSLIADDDSLFLVATSADAAADLLKNLETNP